jgi:Sortase domain
MRAEFFGPRGDAPDAVGYNQPPWPPAGDAPDVIGDNQPPWTRVGDAPDAVGYNQAPWTRAGDAPDAAGYNQPPWPRAGDAPFAPDQAQPALAGDAELAPGQVTASVETHRPGHISPVRVIRRPWAATFAVAGLVVISLGAAGFVWASHTGRPATPVGHSPITPIPAGHYAAAPEAKPQFVPKPTGIVIPAIGVHTSLVRLGLTATGTLQVPGSISVAGWYTGSPRPGAIGSAVIAGHIDSVSGPGVFFRLREMRPGQLIYVQRRQGPTAVFEVTSVQRFLKTRFPTAAVYGPVPDAQLRLVTCGGTFDPATGHYLSNVVVFAVLDPTAS